MGCGPSYEPPETPQEAEARKVAEAIQREWRELVNKAKCLRTTGMTIKDLEYVLGLNPYQTGNVGELQSFLKKELRRRGARG